MFECNGIGGTRGGSPGLDEQRESRDVEALCRTRLGSLDGTAGWRQVETAISAPSL